MAIDDNTVYGLTGAQVKELPGKIDAVKGSVKILTAADYNWPTTNPNGFALWKMEPGLYTLDKDATTEMRPIYYAGTDVASSAVSGVDWATYQGFILTPYRNGSYRGNIATFFSAQGTASFAVYSVSPTVYKAPVFVTNNLTSTSTTAALSANQGRVLKGLIDAIQVPTKTSDLTNDSNFVTSTEMTTALSDKADANDIPTALSELTNDINAVSDANYVHTDNNYTTAEKNKLAGIAAGAEANVQANWAETDTAADSYIQNKPTIPAAQIQSDWNQASTVALDYIKNKPALATVATSGSYSDLTDKPTIPVVHNATLTIQQNGTTVGTFTANSSAATTVDIETPAVFTTNEWNALWA